MLDSLNHKRRLYKNSRILYNCRVSNGAHPCRTSPSSSPGASPKPATAGSNPGPPSPPAAPAPFLTDGRPIGAEGFRVLQHQPLAAFPGRSACSPRPSPASDGVKAFADRFGPLGPDVATQIPLSDQRNAKGVPLGTGEPLSRMER